ncbi:MAG: hypothetical protein AAGI28_13660 [Pseudomonadota bacterium]
MSVIPANYDEWEHCITVSCGIPLTTSFVARRIEALNNLRDHHTSKFVDTWGEAHRLQTIAWFEEAQRRLAS